MKRSVIVNRRGKRGSYGEKAREWRQTAKEERAEKLKPQNANEADMARHVQVMTGLRGEAQQTHRGEYPPYGPRGEE